MHADVDKLAAHIDIFPTLAELAGARVSGAVAAAHPEVVKDMEAAYDKWWQEILPCLENEDAVGAAQNPFKELYWKQFGGPSPSDAPAKQDRPRR